MNEGETVVVSVGGSLIVPDEIDIDFLKNLKEFVLSHNKEGKKFILISGGGKTTRKYQKAANSVTPLSNEDLDWLGIHSTRLNAHLLRSVFYKEAHPRILSDPTKEVPETHDVVIAAGWKPGWSTDYDAVLLAKNVGAKKVVNLSNIDYAYTDDPKENPEAEPIKETDWKSFRELLPKEWDPGLSAPFDPIAAKEADNLNLEVAIINGLKLEEFEKYLEGKPFKGTLIS